MILISLSSLIVQIHAERYICSFEVIRHSPCL